MSAPPFFTAKTLEMPGLRHGFFGRRGGVSHGLYESLNSGLGSEDAPQMVAENRARIAAAMAVSPTHLAGVHQHHSASALHLDAPWPGASPKADALVTATPGLALAILTADCAPVLLAAPAAGVIGAAHAGWRGARGGILEAVLARMQELGAHRQDIRAAIGPCIGPASYQVGPDFVQSFAADADAVPYFRPGAGDRQYFDLGGFCVARLRRAGIGQVECLGLDTCAQSDDFFSYRRACQNGEPDFGRQMSAIALSAGDNGH